MNNGAVEMSSGECPHSLSKLKLVLTNTGQEQ